uniref:Uncharacterized protein n=1 Tax=Arundo donax TaxID=35708 RepID=A0A0A9TWW1_ARUDO
MVAADSDMDPHLGPSPR